MTTRCYGRMTESLRCIMIEVYNLPYRQEVVMSMESIVPRLRIAYFKNMEDPDIMEEIMSQLISLEEDKFIAGFH